MSDFVLKHVNLCKTSVTFIGKSDITSYSSLEYLSGKICSAALHGVFEDLNNDVLVTRLVFSKESPYLTYYPEIKEMYEEGFNRFSIQYKGLFNVNLYFSNELTEELQHDGMQVIIMTFF